MLAREISKKIESELQYPRQIKVNEIRETRAIEYANKNNVPWGISESAYSLKDLQGNYQYKAFGIPMLGLKRGLEEELVISPYATILFLEYEKYEREKDIKCL